MLIFTHYEVFSCFFPKRQLNFANKSIFIGLYFNANIIGAAGSSRVRCSGTSSCTSTCKNRHSNSENSGQNGNAELPANVSPSHYREAGIPLEDEEIKEHENETIDKNFRLMMGLEPENPYADWSCEVNSDGEEVCTCRDYTDNETTANSEDELPSRDVDLSCYSISGDVLNSNGNSTSETPTSRNHRKRKLTENRSSIFSDITSGSSETTSNDRKRLALDESEYFDTRTQAIALHI